MNKKKLTSNGKPIRVYVYTAITCFIWGIAFAYIDLWIEHKTIPPLINMLELIVLFSLGCFIALIFAFELGLPLPAEGKEHYLFLYPAIAVPILLVVIEVKNWILWGRSFFFN